MLQRTPSRKQKDNPQTRRKYSHLPILDGGDMPGYFPQSHITDAQFPHRKWYDVCK